MREYFSGWITAENAFPKKPDPAAFLATLVNHQLLPTETFTIGDRDIDILAAQAAGLPACLYGKPITTCQPELIILNYQQLLNWLKQS